MTLLSVLTDMYVVGGLILGTGGVDSAAGTERWHDDESLYL